MTRSPHSNARSAEDVRRPSVAVVVPTRNEAASIGRLLDSIGWGANGKRPEGSADQVVVVDAESEDDTREIARARGAEVVTERGGRGAQLALGARRAHTDVLLFLHADSALAPGGVEAVREAYRDPDLVATGMRQTIEARGWFYRSVERAANRRVRHGWVYGDSGLGVRARSYRAVGGFPDEPIFEDLDLSRRLRRVGEIRLLDVELRVSARRWEVEGRTRRTVKNWALTVAWLCGVSPRRLARHYPAHDPARDPAHNSAREPVAKTGHGRTRADAKLSGEPANGRRSA